MGDKDEHKDEYKDVSDNLRHYSNLRFAQLTLFSAISGGLIALILSKDTIQASAVPMCLKIAGLLLCLVFLIIEERSTSYWNQLKNRAVTLEEDNGFRQYHEIPDQSRFWTATNAVRILFVVAAAFWFLTIIWPSAFTPKS